jgi:predicted ATPase
MVDTYGKLGYELVELPRAPVAERADFVIAQAGISRAAGDS